eukprot:TRINITY_DN6516_c0_g1_i1.p1 TRINITY_DN6516_c0_g1~~TRINITY_DN6516_c0_g1_i1.p1  ORF type:complete len:275 (-),score=50.57 TRINITY_DN6516_c0_g1_i1:34-858(-)
MKRSPSQSSQSSEELSSPYKPPNKKRRVIHTSSDQTLSASESSTSLDDHQITNEVVLPDEIAKSNSLYDKWKEVNDIFHNEYDDTGLIVLGNDYLLVKHVASKVDQYIKNHGRHAVIITNHIKAWERRFNKSHRNIYQVHTFPELNQGYYYVMQEFLEQISVLLIEPDRFRSIFDRKITIPSGASDECNQSVQIRFRNEILNTGFLVLDRIPLDDQDYFTKKSVHGQCVRNPGHIVIAENDMKDEYLSYAYATRRQFPEDEIEFELLKDQEPEV